MTSREKNMLAVVGVLGLCGVVFGAYQMIVVPLQQAKADAAKLSADRDDKFTAFNKMTTDLRRLANVKKRSLPADLDVARREYEANLSYLLRNAGVPSGFTIVPKDAGDVRSVPEVFPKKPAYVRIGYDIRMQKVELPTLTKVLKAYYELNLLQQITHLDIKRVEKEGNGGIARRGNDRADLEVTIHTEAIILDGAEDRRTLLPVPDAVAAAAGQAAFRAVQAMPEFSKNNKSVQFPSVLATDENKQSREYLVMEARDVFHGPLPPTPPAPKGPDVRPPQPVKELEDISPYIKLNGITTSATGVRQATIWDRSLNYIYEVTLLEEGSKPDVRVRKLSIVAGRSPLPLERSKDLLINQDGTSTDRAFKVMGIYEDGLVLSETVTGSATKDKDGKEEPKAEPKKNNNQRPVGGGGRDKAPPKATKEQLAMSSVIGGVAMTQPTTTELVFHWRMGQPLSSLTPKTALSAEESKELLKKVGSEPASTPVTAPAPSSGVEAAPSPRLTEN